MNYREKQAMLELVNKYVQTEGSVLTVQRYQRVISWLNGMSFAEIGQEEGVSAQAISQSVKRDLVLAKAFAESNDK